MTRTISLRVVSGKPISLALLTIPWPIVSAICRFHSTRVDDHVLLPILGGSESVNSLEVPDKVTFIGEADARNDFLHA